MEPASQSEEDFTVRGKDNALQNQRSPTDTQCPFTVRGKDNALQNQRSPTVTQCPGMLLCVHRHRPPQERVGHFFKKVNKTKEA